MGTRVQCLEKRQQPAVMMQQILPSRGAQGSVDGVHVRLAGGKPLVPDASGVVDGDDVVKASLSRHAGLYAQVCREEWEDFGLFLE